MRGSVQVNLPIVHAYVGVWRAGGVAPVLLGFEPVGLLEFHDGECSSRFVESSAAPLESTCEAGVDFALRVLSSSVAGAFSVPLTSASKCSANAGTS